MKTYHYTFIRTDKLLHLIPLSYDLREEMSALLHKSQFVSQAFFQLQQFHSTIRDGKTLHRFISQFQQGWAHFISSNQIPELALSDDMRFLVLTHIISFYYSAHIKDKNRHQQVADRFGFNLGFITTILEISRKTLNSITNNHIKGIAHQLTQNDESDDIKSLAMALEQVEENGPLKSHSTYIGFILLIKWWWLKKVPFILKSNIRCNNPSHNVHTLTWYYAPTKEFGRYALTADLKDYAGSGAVVFQGITNLCGNFDSIDRQEVNNQFLNAQENTIKIECTELKALKKRIALLDIKEIILCNAALHYQFVDKTKNIDFDRLGDDGQVLKNNYLEIYQNALLKGLCLENPSTLRLIHVYPKLIKRT